MKCWTNLFLIALVLSLGSCVDTSDPNAQINKETKAIDDYLKANNAENVAYNSDGTRIVIKQFGNDAPPHAGQNVKVSYSAYLFPSGTLFDAGTLDEKIDNVAIVGLKDGLQSILSGTHAVLYIPSKNAFGSTGTTSVPANTTVIYDITLEKVTRTDVEQTQFQADTAAIHNYIKNAENNIQDPIMHPSGVWYTIQAAGTGAQPKPYDGATFNYTGKLLSSGSTFSSGSVNSQIIFSFIDGLKLGLPQMQEGGKATFYIPSGYGYGPTGVQGSVAANANLIFQIELNAITHIQ